MPYIEDLTIDWAKIATRIQASIHPSTIGQWAELYYYPALNPYIGSHWQYWNCAQFMYLVEAAHHNKGADKGTVSNIINGLYERVPTNMRGSATWLRNLPSLYPYFPGGLFILGGSVNAYYALYPLKRMKGWGYFSLELPSAYEMYSSWVYSPSYANYYGTGVPMRYGNITVAGVGQGNMTTNMDLSAAMHALEIANDFGETSLVPFIKNFIDAWYIKYPTFADELADPLCTQGWGYYAYCMACQSTIVRELYKAGAITKAQLPTYLAFLNERRQWQDTNPIPYTTQNLPGSGWEYRFNLYLQIFNAQINFVYLNREATGTKYSIPAILGRAVDAGGVTHDVYSVQVSGEPNSNLNMMDFLNNYSLESWSLQEILRAYIDANVTPDGGGGGGGGGGGAFPWWAVAVAGAGVTAGVAIPLGVYLARRKKRKRR